MKILALDDHALFRDGLEQVLHCLDESIEFLHSASMVQAISIIEQHHDIGLLLIDLDMPVNDGFDALSEFTKRYPTLPCAILSASTKRSDLTRALNMGAVGYISKNSDSEVFHKALSLILTGEIYFPYDLLIAERRINNVDRIDLTNRQKQVMTLVKQGYQNKIIADKLKLSEATIKMHLSAIYEKLSVHNRTSAIEQIHKLKINLN